ncbi:MAG TPA: S8 family serine peptidase, partial [Bacteroidia bacterium]|nr:S8 family serine peptidase [Bacteroidia bacterium]
WRGDTNTVIGIVDSGTDWDHPDLAANIKYNWNDPINGADDDNDGFIDNFRGWDISESDNDPMVVNSDHGSHVSGCAAAVVDNNTGVAGPSFLCKFLPVKVSLDASTTSIDNGYDGIVYAADHGANVINCSWGRTGGVSQFEQDIITYATIDKNALVVAASGNDGLEEDHYPSSYKYVLSVGATTSSDSKAGFSNYGYAIDVCAPGNQIYSTVFNDTYTAYSGTSMASPIAAGCAAMVKSRFPSMNSLQVGEQLRTTADDIYSVSGNAPYRNKLGKGRVNLYRAVTDSVSPGVLVDAVHITDNNNEVFVIGDTLDIVAVFKNYLRPTSNLNCVISSTSSAVTILSNTFAAGVIGTLDTVSNYASPYRVLINSTAGSNTEVRFKITMTDGSWSDYHAFIVVVNVDYVNIAINDIASTITSKGLTGYNSSQQTGGLGFYVIA